MKFYCHNSRFCCLTRCWNMSLKNFGFAELLPTYQHSLGNWFLIDFLLDQIFFLDWLSQKSFKLLVFCVVPMKRQRNIFLLAVQSLCRSRKMFIGGLVLHIPRPVTLLITIFIIGIFLEAKNEKSTDKSFSMPRCGLFGL